METHVYNFRIHCKKSSGVIVQLTRALEALQVDILNANVTAIDDHVLNTCVVKVSNRKIVSLTYFMVQKEQAIYFAYFVGEK